MTLAPPRARGLVAAATSRPRALAAAVAVCVLLAVGVVVTLGTGGSTPGTHPTSGTGAQPAAVASTRATRWWSNAGAKSGSGIDASAPLAVADRLHSSRKDYCGMLRQTLKARGSVLAGISASDPALLTTTRAFVGELRAVAPHTVADPWRVVGNAMIALVSLGGRPTGVPGIDAAAVGSAERAIARDAKSGCGVDLSSK